jgi:hypothetical protein
VTSFVRESLLLNAMQREIDGHAFINRGLIEGAITNIVAPSGRSSAYRKAINYLMQGNNLCKGGSYRALKKAQISEKDEFEIRQAAAAFKLLKRTNFYDKMSATLKAEAIRK